jgi:NADPH2 dehydrogenase
MYSADDEGMVQPFHVVHYGTRAQGGVGLIIMEATAVEPRGRITNRDLGIWSNSHIAGLKSIVDMVHGFGTKIALQLAHAGRKSETKGSKSISSWDTAFSDDYPTPKKMTHQDIREVIRAFGEGARRAAEAGFDMVEIHGAHGYLINQFISSAINQRQDEYGCHDGFGIMFVRDIIRAVKRQFSGHVALRISAEEYDQKGLHPRDYVTLLKALQQDDETRLDLLDVSSGGVTAVVPNIRFVPGYQIEFAHILKRELSIPVLTGGLLSDPKAIEQILASEKADLVWLGRELLRNPYWPLQASEQLESPMEKPPQYRRAEPYMK